MVVAIIIGVLALGLGTPTVLHLREQRAKAEELDAERRDAEKAERKKKEGVAARDALKAATEDREAAEAAFRADPEAHVIPNVRDALDVSVHPIQDEMDAADREIETATTELAKAEARVAEIEKDMPGWLLEPAGEAKVNLAVMLAPFVLVAVLALDYTMFASTYGRWQAALYTVVTVVVSTFVGLKAVTAIPALFRLPEEPIERFKARLSAGAAISALVIVIAGLLWLAPNRSHANNATQIAAAEQALADSQAGVTVSQETVALLESELESAMDRADLDKTIDQAMVLAMLGADLLVAEGALLAFSTVRPRRRAKLVVDNTASHIGALREQRARLDAEHRATARQVGTRVWSYLQQMNVPQPEVVILNAMSRIAAADPVHYQVIRQGADGYQGHTPPTPADVVIGEVVGAGHPAPAEPAPTPPSPPTPIIETLDGIHPAAGALMDEAPGRVDDDTIDPMPDVPSLDELVAL